MRVFAPLAIIAVLSAPSMAPAQETPVPDRRAVTLMNKDFFGGDLDRINDTSFRKCVTECIGNSACNALTFNSRNNVCFLKDGVSRVEDFKGAISTQLFPVDDAVRTLAAERVGDLDMLPGHLIDAARKLAVDIGVRIAANGSDAATLRATASNAEAEGDLKTAAQSYAAAVTVSDESDDWRDLARVWGEMKGEKSSDKRRLRREALSAAINAYLRAPDNAARATSLNLLAERLRADNRGRDMIPVLELSLSIADRRDTQEKLAFAITNFGFRVTGHSVDSDPATARLCVKFSEPLAETGIDYAPFIRVAGHDGLPVDAKGEQLCIDGLIHGQRYAVTVRANLPSADGKTTSRPAEIEAYVRDRSPTVRFTGRDYVLPKSARASIPIVTVNMSEVELAIHRIGARSLLPAIQNELFGKGLTEWREDKISQEQGEAVWTGTVEVASRVNADITTAVPVGEAIETFKPGVYAMSARIPGADDRWDRAATQWFVVTDLGLASMAGADGLHGFVRTLSSADPVEGASVTLIARNNDVLGNTTSDARGYVRFDPGLSRGQGGSRPALLTVERDGDYAFIDLSKPGFDLSDRGVEGRPAPGPVDVFATTERGVYRPGEIVHLTALARDGRADAIADLPLTLVVTRPDGVEYQRTVLRDQGAGGRAHSMRLGTGVPRGPWKANLYTDPTAPPVTQLAFLVEDFVPERIDFDLSAPEGLIQRNQPFTIDLAARYLYGAPGADLPVEGRVQVRTTVELPGYPGFKFGLGEEEPLSVTDTMPSLVTDASGNLSFDLPIPDVSDVTRPMNLTAIVHVTDSSGRPVERTLTRPLASAGVRLGVRPMFEGAADEGSTAEFEVLAVGSDGNQTALETVAWTLSRLNRDWQWYRLDGEWRWEVNVTRERVASGTVALTADGRAKIQASVDWGAYELSLASLDGAEAAASHRFYAGWYTGGAASDTPDVLEVGLDKAAYAVGETAKLRLKPRHAGKVLVAVVDNRLIEMRAIDVAAGETTVDLPVTADWGPGAYVTATLIRPMDEAAKRNPSRAMGLAWATVDPAERRLGVTVTTPDQVAPRGPLDARIRIDGLQAGERAYVTIAAVDLGILNLTGFESPDPAEHYFGQRALGMEMRDLYGKLIDGMQGDPGRLRSGGDAEARRQQMAPPSDDLVAYFSGVLEVGPDGTATAPFEVPDFNGTVRVMAIAWTDKAVGNAEKDILVRDPIVVSAAIPRFMSPRDRSRILLDVAHAFGPAGEVEVVLETDGGISVDPTPQIVDVAEGQISQISLPITAVEIGNPEFRIRTRTPGGEALFKDLTLPVRLNDPEIARQNKIALPPGGRLVIDAATFNGLEPGTGRATLGVGPVAAFDAPGLLQELDRYPYGCTEQTTSRALPLLYLSQVASALGMTERDGVEERINAAIARVLENQSSSGAFGLWRPGRDDLWLDAYVSDFLSRAKAEGYAVPKTAFDAAIDNLRSQLTYVGDFQNAGEDIAYALLVLAREGAASIGDLRYYADAKADDFATPMAKAQIGAALALYGERTRADAMFRAAADDVLAIETDDTGWRIDYGSALRDGAAVLALAAEARSEAINSNAIVNALADRKGRWTSTQEKVWMLMATNAMMTQDVAGLTVNGEAASGAMIRAFDDQTIGTGAVVIENTSNTATQAVLSTYGVPTEPEPAGGRGYRIERAYYAMDGQPVSTEQVIQNDRLAVVLTIQSEERRTARLMVDDPLPAGFEIDNPNLLRAGSVGTLDWLQTIEEVETAQFMTERFRAAVDFSGTGSFKLAYIVRAVSPGMFHHPAALVEDMYRPDFRAWTDTGSVEVVEGTP
ncbi:MAG: alpha-2-macroglobulin family protein [Pseudomonadota bacterium]